VGLTVLNVAYPLSPVGRDAVGGAEQVVSALDAALVQRGHRSLVLACEGSRVQGELFSSGAPGPLLDAAARAQAVERQRSALSAILRSRQVDVVHLHGIDFAEYLPLAGPPVVVTLHLPLSWYPAHALCPTRDDQRLVCVSESQLASAELQCRPLVIENGVALDVYRPLGRKRDFALALGRICPEKGMHLALDAARRANVALLIGGAAFGYPEHQTYLQGSVEPRLDRRRRLLGPLSLERKRRLLAAARCVIVPSLAPETSSLVTMEALASGTPVVAFDVGALPELIEHGRTGFVVQDVSQMADAIEHTRALRPSHCRQAAEERFSEAATADRYIALYDDLARVRSRRTQRAPLANEAPPSAGALALIDEITTLSELERLAPEWTALWEAAPAASVFQRPEWLLAFCRHLLDSELRVLALRERGRLVGLAPFCVSEQGGTRVLRLLGAPVTDYLDLLVDPRHAQTIERTLCDWLAHARGFDVCVFECLRSDSLLLSARTPHGFCDSVQVQEVAPQLIVPGDGAAFAAGLPKLFREQLRRAWARAGRLGVTREVGGDEHAQEYLSALFELHGASWRARGGAGVLHGAAVQAFHRDLVAAFAGHGFVSFTGLRRDGVLSAVVYAFRDRDCERFYLSGFDPAFSRASFGTLAVHQAIESGIDRGVRAFDFLRGGEAYKYGWGARDRQLSVRTLAQAARARQASSALRVAAAGAQT
jgi:CelD/BcsL family acetyltransferase involved in cellulose biosynthesis/glycosyltransferase involved in cell wall biosynthesis